MDRSDALAVQHIALPIITREHGHSRAHVPLQPIDIGTVLQAQRRMGVAPAEMVRLSPCVSFSSPSAGALQRFQRWLNRLATISSKASGLSTKPFAIANLFNPSTTSVEMVAS